jgi:hypothetical protein
MRVMEVSKHWIKPRAWYVAKIISLPTRKERGAFLRQEVPGHLQRDVRTEVERLFATRSRSCGRMEGGSTGEGPHAGA